MKKAFTLIELLVVIAIIGSLAAMMLPNFMAVREKARDTQRKSDLKTIQKAFEIYKQDQSPEAYPTGSAQTSKMPAIATCFSSGVGCTENIYTSHFPGDPLPNYNYIYTPPVAGSLTYTICACIENKADPDSTAGSCGGTCTNGSNKNYIVTQP